MPVDALKNDNEEVVSQKLVSEVVSQHQKFILGAKLENADFQFIPRTDAITFASLPEGAFFTDVDENGLNWVGRKIDGKRKYLAYDDDIKAYVTDEVAKLYPVAIKNAEDGLPTSTRDKPLFEGRRVVFLFSGEVEGTEVTAGATATVSRTIPLGESLTWGDLLYNSAEQIEITPINLSDVVRRDGSASTTEGVTERAVADALDATESALNQSISEVDGRLTSEISNVSNSVSSLRIEQGEQDERLTELENAPQWLEEFIKIGDGVNQVITKTLANQYINTPIVTWFMLMNGKYMEINKQDSDFITEQGVPKIVCAFAGVPAQDQFRVSVQGLARLVTA